MKFKTFKIKICKKKDLKNIIYRKLFSLIILIGIAFNSVNFASAQWVVTDPGNTLQSSLNLIQGTANAASNYASKYFNSQEYLKNFFLDVAAKMVAKQAIDTIKKQTLQWANSGFKGKPLFLQNPEQFFNNIVSDQVSLVKQEILKAGNMNTKALQSMIEKVGRTNVQSPLSQFNLDMNYSLREEVCKNMRTNFNRQILAEQDAINRAALKSEKEKIYQDACSLNLTDSPTKKVATDTQSDADKKFEKCASDFGCGGWDAILTKTSNFSRASDVGKEEILQNEVDRRITDEKQKAKDELAQNGGVFSDKVCVLEADGANGKKICKQYAVKTPGTSVAAAINQTVTEPIASLLQVKSYKEDFFTQIAVAFATGVIQRGINSIATQINGAVNDVSKDLLSDLNTMYATNSTITPRIIGSNNLSGSDMFFSGSSGSTSGGGGSVSSGGTGNNSTGGGGSSGAGSSGTGSNQTGPITLKVSSFASDLQPIVGPMIQAYDGAKNNYLSKISGSNSGELVAYQNLLASLKKIDVCYQDKATNFPQLVKYPDSVPPSVRDRYTEVSNIVSSMTNNGSGGAAGTTNNSYTAELDSIMRELQAFSGASNSVDNGIKVMDISNRFYTALDNLKNKASTAVNDQANSGARVQAINTEADQLINNSNGLSQLDVCMKIGVDTTVR